MAAVVGLGLAAAGIGLWSITRPKVVIPEPGQSFVATLDFSPVLFPVPAPSTLVVLRPLVEPYQFVRKGAPVIEAYASQVTLDEALAVAGLRLTVEEMLVATNGKATPSIKQFQQKIAFSEQMMRRGGKLRTIRAPRDGVVMPFDRSQLRVRKAGDRLMQIADPTVLRAQATLLAPVKTGTSVRIRNWQSPLEEAGVLTLSGDAPNLESRMAWGRLLPQTDLEQERFSANARVSLRSVARAGTPLPLDPVAVESVEGVVDLATDWVLEPDQKRAAEVESSLKKRLTGQVVQVPGKGVRTIGEVKAVEVQRQVRKTGSGREVTVIVSGLPDWLRAYWQTALRRGVKLRAEAEFVAAP